MWQCPLCKQWITFSSTKHKLRFYADRHLKVCEAKKEVLTNE